MGFIIGAVVNWVSAAVGGTIGGIAANYTYDCYSYYFEKKKESCNKKKKRKRGDDE